MASGDNERHEEDIMHDMPPADGSPTSFLGAIEAIISNWFSDKQFCTLGKVEEYDREKHEAVVQPMVKIVGTAGHEVEPAKVKCTVHRFSACGYVIDMPIQKGDTGWIIAADVDTTESKKSKEVELPLSLIRNQYRFGYFIPDAFGKRPVNEDDKEGNRLVIASEDYNQRISIGQSDIQVQCGRLIIDAESIEMTAVERLEFNCPSIRLNGKVNMKPGFSGTLNMFTIANVQDGIVTGVYKEP